MIWELFARQSAESLSLRNSFITISSRHWFLGQDLWQLFVNYHAKLDLLNSRVNGKSDQLVAEVIWRISG